MTNQPTDVKATTAENATKLNGKFKETWSKLTDSDIALYSTKRDQFAGKLKALYSLSAEDAETKIKALEEQCGMGKAASTKAA